MMLPGVAINTALSCSGPAADAGGALDAVADHPDGCCIERCCRLPCSWSSCTASRPWGKPLLPGGQMALVSLATSSETRHRCNRSRCAAVVAAEGQVGRSRSHLQVAHAPFHRTERRIQITGRFPQREGSTCARAGLSAPPALRRALYTSVRCALRLQGRDRATTCRRCRRSPLPPLSCRRCRNLPPAPQTPPDLGSP